MANTVMLGNTQDVFEIPIKWPTSDVSNQQMAIVGVISYQFVPTIGIAYFCFGQSVDFNLFLSDSC